MAGQTCKRHVVTSPGSEAKSYMDALDDELEYGGNSPQLQQEQLVPLADGVAGGNDRVGVLSDAQMGEVFQPCDGATRGV